MKTDRPACNTLEMDYTMKIRSPTSQLSRFYISKSPYIADLVEHNLYWAGFNVDVLELKMSDLKKTHDPDYPDEIYYNMFTCSHRGAAGRFPELADIEKSWYESFLELSDMVCLIRDNPKLTDVVGRSRYLKK